MCVPGVRQCVISKKHMSGVELNASMRVPQVNVYVCVHGCTSARAACTVSVVYIGVSHVYAHVCLNWAGVSEPPM